MNGQVKKVIFSKTFWVILGLGVLLWALQKYAYWKPDIIYLVYSGPYTISLVIPMVIFYRGVSRNRYLLYFIITLISLILWVLWSLFWFAIWTKGFVGWFALTDFFNYFIYSVITFFVFSVAYTFICYHLLPLQKLSAINKRVFIWLGWFVGLGGILAITLWYLHIEIETSSRYIPDIILSYIHHSIEFFLMWLVFTLLPTLKIDAFLSKGN